MHCVEQLDLHLVAGGLKVVGTLLKISPAKTSESQEVEIEQALPATRASSSSSSSSSWQNPLPAADDEFQQAEPVWHILGCVSARPLTHVLFALKDNDSKFTFAEADDDVEITTSHCVFKTLLVQMQAKGTILQFDVQAWKFAEQYYGDHNEELGNHFAFQYPGIAPMYSCTLGDGAESAPKLTRAKPKAQKMKMPFGLKLPKDQKAKARAKSSNKKPKTPSGSSAEQEGEKLEPEAKKRNTSSGSAEQEGKKLESKDSNELQAESDEDEEEDQTDDSQDDGPPDNKYIKVVYDDDEPANEFFGDDVIQEFKKLNELQEQFAKDVIAGEVDDAQPACTAGAKATAKPKAKYKAKFNQRVGVRGVEIAPSGHSKCYLCNEMIPKGSIRFEYYFNESSISRRIHTACASRILDEPLVAKSNSISWLQGKLAEPNVQWQEQLAGALSALS